MSTTLETLTLQDVKDAVKKSLGLESEDYISEDTSLKILNSDVEPADLLEIFQKVGITPTELKPYMTDGGLTKEGKDYLRKATTGLTSKPSIKLYNLANTKSLDDFAKQITPRDIYNIANYKLRE